MFFAAFPLAFALVQSSLASQTGAQRAYAAPRPDSARIVRDVRSAQSSFESFRRGRLPVREHGSGNCDIRIGRYCYWRGDDDDEDATPPEEPQPVRDRRTGLILLMDAAAQSLPGDRWLAGQLVRYLVESERTDDALRFASTCGAGAAWCNALAGYAAHSAGRFALADSAFRTALAAMEPAERCRWLDVADVIDDEVSDRFKKTNCDDREKFVRRVFRLGSPLFSVSESDLLTEHLARVTRARIAEHSPTADGEPWADDERELMIRYGWPRWYSRSETPIGLSMQPSVMGHDGGLPYDFLPKMHAVEHIGTATAGDWVLDDSRATAGYAPSYIRSMHELPSQVAAFRRGDSTLVLAAWDGRRDTTLLGRDLNAALVLVGLDSTAAIARQAHSGAAGRITATGVLDSGLASVEVLAPTERRAARAHIGLPERRGANAALSDLLLYAPSDSAATDLASASATMLASSSMSGTRNVGAFWEAYGIPEHTRPVHYVLSVEQFGIGWLQRAKERLHLDDPSTGLRIQWDEVPQPVNGIASRAVRLDLSRLRGGRYHIEVSMTIDGEVPVVASRDVEVR